MNKILKNLTVLLVEDDSDSKKIMHDVLSDNFEKVFTAQNGDEGLKKFKKYNPNMVITDVFMPISDGLDMTRYIKEISKDTPVIVLSAHSEKETLLKAIDVGVDKYLIKPIMADDLLKTIENVAKSKIETANIIQVANGYSFNKIKRVLIRDGVEISLTKKELAFISLLIKRRLKIFACSGLFSLLFSKVSLVSLEQISAHFSLILGSTMILKVSYSKHSKIRSVVVLLNPISLQKMKSIFSFLRI